MANQYFSRVIPKTLTLTSFFSRRSLSTTTVSSLPRPLSAATIISHRALLLNSFRSLSTRATTSSLNDPDPNWSYSPPKETISPDGCDFEHWLVVMEKPDGDPSRDEIIDGYIKTLAQVIGSEEEARMKIYSVSTRYYFAFGALCSEELSFEIKKLPNVRWVLPDSYLNPKEKDYGGEPFINGKAVPYDPKYHEECVRNNPKKHPGRPCCIVKLTQTRPPPPLPPHAQAPGGGFPPNNGGGYPPNNGAGYAPVPKSNQAGYGPPNPRGYGPPNPNGYGPPHPNGYGPPHPRGYGLPNPNGYGPPNPNSGGYPPNNTGGYPPNSNMNRGPPPHAQTSGGCKANETNGCKDRPKNFDLVLNIKIKILCKDVSKGDP